MSLKRGFFISFEGPEGSGKSSQAKRLVKALRRAGHSVVFVRDPGSTTLGMRLRQVLLHDRHEVPPLVEALLFIAGRVQLVKQRIKPSLERGKIVVCDRFHDSTVAYQGFGGGLDVRWLDRFGRSTIDGMLPPLTILLDIPTARGFARLSRSRDRMERKARGFHRRVRTGYRRLAKREPRRFVVIDATKAPQTIASQIESVVMRRLRRER